MTETDTTAGHQSPGHLLRVLGLGFGVAIGVGSMIGGGILRTPGLVADHVPQPTLILLLWTLGGLHALLGANIVAEVMTSLPRSGGLYVASRRAFGDFGGLVVGWSDWLFSTATSAGLTIAASEFLALIFPVLAGHKTAVAVSILLVLIGLNWAGVREGSIAQQLTSGLKGLLLIVLISTVFFLVPSAPVQVHGPSMGASLIMSAAVAYQFVFTAYNGWQYPSYFSEEDPRPAKNMPRALLLSILAVAAVYTTMNVALLHALPIEQMRHAELPVATALGNLVGPAAKLVVAVIATVSVISCLNGVVMLMPRILYGLGRDGLFPSFSTRVNRGGTPHLALAVSAVVAILLTLSGSYEKVFLISGVFGVFILFMTDISLFMLRRREPGLARPYRALGYPVLPALVLLIDGTLLVAFLAADPKSGFGVVAAAALSLPISLWLKRRRSGQAAPASSL